MPNTTPLSGRARRAVIVGGSISGLYAALLLSRHGWHVDVYERTLGELAGRGAGIVAQPALRAALHAAGIDSARDLGIRVADRVLLDRSGAEILRHACPQTVTSWEYIHALLRAHVPAARYHAGFELRDITLDGAMATAHFTSPSLGAYSVGADLIIGADGIRSTVRQQMFPATRPKYAGYVAWRGLVDERAFSPVTHAAIFWTFAFGLPVGEQFIAYPVTGPGDDLTPGNLRYNFLWYRPADEATELKRLLTDETGHVHALAIPPPLISAKARDGMRADAARLLAPQFQEVIAMSPLPFLQPIYDLESSRLAHGPVAVIGDAAFVARPHLAAGVIKAVEDAQALVAALDAEPDVAIALTRYETNRLPIGRRLVARARAMGENYRPAAADQPRQSDRDTDYARAVVADTALMDFLSEASALQVPNDH